MSKLVKTEVVAIDKEMATILLSTNIFPRQRPVRPSQVERLSKALQTNTFKPGTIELCRWGDKDYLMDGQHRLTAIVATDTCAVMNIAYYEAQSEAELNAHYYRTDNNLKRNSVDTVRALGISEQWNMPERSVQRYSTAAKFYLEWFKQEEGQTIRRGMTTVEDRTAVMEAFLPQERVFQDILLGIKNVTRDILETSAIHAVALITLRDQPEKAETFWQNIASNDGLRTGTPEHTFINTFLVMRGALKGSNRNDAWKVRAIALAWNAFYAGKSITRIQPHLDAPIILLGTEFSRAKQAARKESF